MKNWKKENKVEAIFIDVDGTLTLKNQFKLHKELEESLKLAQEKKIYIVISTGRGIWAVEKLHQQYYHNDYGRYVIHTIGAVVTDFKENRNLLEICLDKEDIKSLIAFVKENKFDFYDDTSRNIYTTDSFFKRMSHNLSFSKQGWKICKLKKVENENISLKACKFSIKTDLPKEKTLEVMKTLKTKFPNVEITLSGSDLVEVTKKNISKASAAFALCKELGIDIKNTIAIGDSLNDVELLKVVGHPVAMGNAMNEIKQFCKYHTASNKELGVKKVIDIILDALNN